MKTSVYRNLVTVILIAVFQFALATEGNEVSRSFEKSFPLTGHAKLEIDNRYGNIDIRNWEKDEISVSVNVIVTHSNRETADRQLSYINIGFSQEENSIKAITTIDQRIGRMSSRWFSQGEDGPGISINYTVYAPKDSDLLLNHRYGDIFINEATGHTFIDLRYGNLQANHIIRDNTRPLSEINLSYSTKANITNAEWLKINMKYSDLTVEQCRALVVSSSYSKLRVDQASSIVAETRYGEFNLGYISNLVSEGAYTNYSVKELENTLDIESRYGNVRVDEIATDFSKIRFNSSYGNIRAGMDKNASYRIESSASYGTVSIPSSDRVNRTGSGNQSAISGIVGREQNPSSIVEITTRYGNVNLTAR